MILSSKTCHYTPNLSEPPPPLNRPGEIGLSNAKFWQYIKGLKNRIHAAVRRNLEENLEVKTFLKMSIGFKCQGPN